MLRHTHTLHVRGCLLSRLASDRLVHCYSAASSNPAGDSRDAAGDDEPSPPAAARSFQPEQLQEQHAQTGHEHQPQGDSAAAVPHQQHQQARYSPEQQLLKTAMKKLKALEDYQQLLSDCSGSSSSGGSLTRQPGDTPAEVADKIAADRDEVPLLDAAILIAQVTHTHRGTGSRVCV